VNRRPFALWPPLTLALLVGPVAAGLAGTVAPALGVLPALGLDQPGFAAFGELARLPGLAGSTALAVWVALASTALACGLAAAFVAATASLPGWAWLRRLVTPLMAAPHVAVAAGMAFLLAPSGLLVRLVSPGLTGFDFPPLWGFPNDPFGLALILGLVVKETPFLVLMLLAQQAARPVELELTAARAMGRDAFSAWSLVVLPQLYAGMRLPIFAVLAYGFSPVDMAMVLGPSAPPILAVRVIELLGDPDLQRWPVGAAAALWLLALALAAMALWLGLERVARWLGRLWVEAGASGRSRSWAAALALATPAALGALGLVALATMPLWSIAGRWRFPNTWPDMLTLERWREAPTLAGEPILTTLVLAAGVAGAALLLTLLCLEAETHRRRPLSRRVWLWLFLPLVLPQAAFLFGVQVLLAALRVDGTLAAVALVQLTFVLPYVFLALAGAYRALDPRWALTARGLGHRPWSVLWRIKLPLLAAPAATAFAVGFAVSAALYLPTLFAGGGRVRTLALEAVSLAGSDRRSAGVVVTVLAALPLVAFAGAALVRRRVERHR